MAQKNHQGKLQGARDKHDKVAQRGSDAQALRQQTAVLLDKIVTDAALVAKLQPMRAEALGEQPFTLESCDNREQDLHKWLQAA